LVVRGGTVENLLGLSRAPRNSSDTTESEPAFTIVPSSITSAAAAEVSANSYDARSRTFR
jgi:hypothetical protein